VHEGDVKLRRGRLHWLAVVAVVVLPVVLAAVGAALILVTQQRTYRASATVVPPSPSRGGTRTIAIAPPPDRAAEGLARSPRVVEAVVERAHDASITPGWLRQHTAISSRMWESLTLTIASAQRTHAVRVANIYTTVFAKAWRPQAQAPLRRALRSPHIRDLRSCVVQHGKVCVRYVSERRVLAGLLSRGMFVARPKDASQCLCGGCLP
jgi:hypothetical protein